MLEFLKFLLVEFYSWQQTNSSLALVDMKLILIQSGQKTKKKYIKFTDIEIFGTCLFSHQRSFNLEGGVEKGGYLRVVTLDKNGFRAHEVKNHVFNLRESNKPLPSQNMTVDEMVGYFRNHELVVENKLDDNISSFSFTRKAFRDRNWDAVNARARGIFVNTDTNKIVARSYDKMFHINEREFTKIGYLKENLVFPVRLMKK